MSEDVLDLAERLRSVVGVLVRAARTVDTLPPGEAATLGILDREGPRTTAQLAVLRAVRHQSMAKIVNHLHAAGLVGKQPHEVDRRMTVLWITDGGRQVLARERRRRTDSLATALDAELDDAERAVVAACLPLLDRVATHVRNTAAGRPRGALAGRVDDPEVSGSDSP
jgi:DNA-binding MarR family transcriptional regulator